MSAPSRLRNTVGRPMITRTGGRLTGRALEALSADHTTATLGGLAVLIAALIGAGMPAGPLVLGLSSSIFLQAVRVVADKYFQLALIRRACDLAKDVAELPLGLALPCGTGSGRSADPPVQAHSRTNSIGGPKRPAADRPRAFWAALTAEERRALRALGARRFFPRGSFLFQESDRAGHVAVILSGRTKVCVDDGGRERIVAKRGPGHLIGERAALRESVRSASVVALDDVQALMMRTEDFARFLAEHPHVLGIVEGQIYGRLVEPEDGGNEATGTTRDGHSLTPSPRKAGGFHFNGQVCLVLLTDVASFAAPIRTDEDREHVRGAQFKVIQEALAQSPVGGLDQCHWEDRGDGLLIVVPPEFAARTVLAAMLPSLEIGLVEHDRWYTEPVKIKLRLSVHLGPVFSDQVGVSGEVIIQAARNLDAEELREALRRSTACLGIIASSVVYDTVIRQSVAKLRPFEYTEVRGLVKESRITAWMRLAGRIPDAR